MSKSLKVPSTRKQFDRRITLNCSSHVHCLLVFEQPRGEPSNGFSTGAPQSLDLPLLAAIRLVSQRRLWASCLRSHALGGQTAISTTDFPVAWPANLAHHTDTLCPLISPITVSSVLPYTSVALGKSTEIGSPRRLFFV